jgi:hypothetical protein
MVVDICNVNLYSGALSSERKAGIYCRKERTTETDRRLSIFSTLLVSLIRSRSCLQYIPVYRSEAGHCLADYEDMQANFTLEQC